MFKTETSQQRVSNSRDIRIHVHVWKDSPLDCITYEQLRLCYIIEELELQVSRLVIRKGANYGNAKIKKVVARVSRSYLIGALCFMTLNVFPLFFISILKLIYRAVQIL